MSAVRVASVETTAPSPGRHLAFLPQPLSAEDLAFVIDFVRRHAAIVVPVEKAYLVESRLATVLGPRGGGTVAEFIARLREDPEDEIGTRIVEAMLTTETSFFRDRRALDTICRTVIPELMDRRRDARRLAIWSAACSSGQEPYSLLMTLGARLPELLTNWELEFHASDISQRMLDRTRAGRYSQLEINRGLSPELTTTHFARNGKAWQIDESLRNRLQLSQLNLAGDWPGMPRLDLVLMRNVLIYFDTETRKRVLGKVCDLLQPDGYLALGGAETTLNLSDRLEPRRIDGVTFYRLAS